MIGLEVVVTACLLTNAAGLAASAFVLNRRRINPTGPRLISFAVGVLLGVVLLDLLPHLWEATGNLAALLGLFAAALLASWLMEWTVRVHAIISLSCAMPRRHINTTAAIGLRPRAARGCCWSATSCTASSTVR